MRAKWTIILACVFVVVAVAAERLGAKRLEMLGLRRSDLQTKLKEAEARTLSGARERQRYEQILAAADRLEARLVWENDSTNLLRWFADTAAETGIRLSSGKVQVAARGEKPVADGKFMPLRFDLRLEGSYWPLVRYIERIENSPSPILIETVTLNADHSLQGEGSLHLLVVSLYRIETDEKTPEKPS
jgi:hypothetical protein